MIFLPVKKVRAVFVPSHGMWKLQHSYLTIVWTDYTILQRDIGCIKLFGTERYAKEYAAKFVGVPV